MSQQHVMELVHHEQEQVFVRPALAADEVGIDAEDWTPLARDRGGGNGVGLIDAQQRQQRVHLEGAGWDGVQHAGSQVVHRSTSVSLAGKEQRDATHRDQRRLESSGKVERSGTGRQNRDRRCKWDAD